MKITTSYRFIGILIFPIVLFSAIYFICRKPDIDFIQNRNFYISNFTDIKDSGNSICEIKKSENQLQTNYTLHSGYLYPYAGIRIKHAGNTLFDITSYNCNLILDADQDFRASIRMSQFLESYSDTNKPLSLLVLVKTLGFKKGENSFQLAINDINEIPDWWYKNNPEIGNKYKMFSAEKTSDLWLFSDYSTPVNQNISFTIREFKLTYNFYPLLYWALILSFIYYSLLFVLWKFKKEKIKYIFMPIEMTQVNEKVPKLQADILAYIGLHYPNPDLKLIDVAKNVGLSEDVTSDLLRKYSKKNFRQYLNQIRMEEAKRLLKESSLQIAEIAFKVGYNNIQHFNRVFKEYTDDSPKSYREL